MSLYRRSELGSSYKVEDLPKLQSSHSPNDRRRLRPGEDLHYHDAVVKTYDRLKQRITDFDHQLGLFLSECRQLGRSYALILAAHDLRKGLENLLTMFYENTTHLTPYILESRAALSLNATDEPFYFWLEALAKVCDTFRERLNEFREYTEENAKVKKFMMTFSEVLMYRAFCLQLHKDSLNTTYIRHYINDLADEMGQDLDNLVFAFKFFNQYGMPAMQYEQRRATEVLFTLSTVSTFFSAVTATTLQTSLSIQGNESNSLIFVVNTFLFSSLIFSIGSALNSLLAVVWKRTPYGSRGSRLPVWVTIWIHGSAPVFLAISIASFSAGLVLFVYSSGQKKHTKIVTTVTTAITSFGLVIIAVWFGYEQYIAPFLLPDAPWLGKRIHEWNSSMSERSHHVILSGNQRTEDYTAGSLATEEAQGQTRMPLRHGVKFDLILKAASRAFEGQSQSAATSTVMDETTLISTPTHDTIPVKSPFLLSIPDNPFLTISLTAEAIHDIEYSPNGKYLAATRYDEEMNTSTTDIYTGHDAPTFSYYTHSLHQISHHISWFSNSKILLIRLSHSVDFVDVNCHLISTVKRPHLVESASWISSSNTDFLLAERSTVLKLNIQGHVQVIHKFDNLLLRDIAVVPDSSLLLLTGHIIHSRLEAVHITGRAEKQIILYDSQNEQILSRHPSLDEMHYIRIAPGITNTRDGFDILLSHKSGVSQPFSRLWMLQRQTLGRYELLPGAMDLHPISKLSGYGYFIGEGDEMIACVDIDGDVHIWDRETARSICRIPARATGHGIRCFTWSAASATFASVDNEGKKLNIWSIVYKDKEDGFPETRV